MLEKREKQFEIKRRRQGVPLKRLKLQKLT